MFHLALYNTYRAHSVGRFKCLFFTSSPAYRHDVHQNHPRSSFFLLRSSLDNMRQLMGQYSQKFDQLCDSNAQLLMAIFAFVQFPFQFAMCNQRGDFLIFFLLFIQLFICLFASERMEMKSEFSFRAIYKIHTICMRKPATTTTRAHQRRAEGNKNQVNSSHIFPLCGFSLVPCVDVAVVVAVGCLKTN